jgi:hypothetical protein
MDYNLAFPVIKETVPKSDLGYHSNNKYDGYPAFMSDGRSVMGAYRTEAQLNYSIQQEGSKIKEFKTNQEYRNYLINNGLKIIADDFRKASNDSGHYIM